MVRRHEQLAVQMRRILIAEVGVAHHDVGEGVGLEVVEEVRALGPGQVVEAVAELQALHLEFEHVVEGRAQHAAEFRALFGKAADPEIDHVQASLDRRPRRRCLFRKSTRSVAPPATMPSASAPSTPNTSSSAARRLSATVVADVMVLCVP